MRAYDSSFVRASPADDDDEDDEDEEEDDRRKDKGARAALTCCEATPVERKALEEIRKSEWASIFSINVS